MKETETLTEYIQSLMFKPKSENIKPKSKNPGANKDVVIKLINMFIIPSLNQLLVDFGFYESTSKLIINFPLGFKVAGIDLDTDYVRLAFDFCDSNGFKLIEYPSPFEEDLFKIAIKACFKELGLEEPERISVGYRGIEIASYDSIGHLLLKSE